MAKRDLRKKGGPIVTGKFNMEESRLYVMIGIIYFHIVPLVFVFMGGMGQQILQSIFLDKLNPIMIFCLCCFHATRLGFCFKFPGIISILSSLSLFMYYSLGNVYGLGETNPGLGIVIFVMFTLVYVLFAFASELIGGFIKKLLGGE